ncbi:MAG: twin-arginine translocase TatA/TatE family subunit [Eubacteriaceae bacterium]
MRVGTSELLLILVVALLVLGPEKMPIYAKKVGKALNTLKSYTGKLSEDINDNIVEPLQEVQKPLKNVTDPLTNITKDISKPMEDIKSSINDIGKVKNKEKEKEEVSLADNEKIEVKGEVSQVLEEEQISK